MPDAVSSAPNKQQEFKDIERAAQLALKRLGDEIARQQAGEGPATGFAPIKEVLNTLEVDRWLQQGGMDSDSFDGFLADYLKFSVKFHHPGYIAHQVSVPGFPGALAALVNGFTNNPMAVYEMGAGAAALELAVTNWMLAKIGWRPQPLPGEISSAGHGAGVLTHGGSVGNLTALLAARARIAPAAWTEGCPGDLAVLVPPVSHYSIDRAVSIMGLGGQAIFPVPGTADGVMDPDGLANTVQKIKADGRRCMALVANACATATGLHDPLRPLGEFCRANNIWLHVDACHGATALLARDSRKFLDGIELADSIVWDAHKMMQVPVLCAAVLYRKARDMYGAFQQDASYLALDADPERYSPMPFALECTKAALGLKIFLTLAWWGEERLGDYVDSRYAATRRFYEIITARPGFSCPYQPEANILCFRFKDDDALQDQIREQLLKEHSFHLTAATLGGRRYLRMTVMSPQTKDGTIESLLNAIECIADG